MLRRLPAMVERRRDNAAALVDALRPYPSMRTPVPAAHIKHSYYRFYTYAVPERLREGWTRDHLIGAFNAEGIPCFSGACSEIYLEKAFLEEWRPAQRHPVAKELGETCVMFLVHSKVGDSEIRDMRTAIDKVLSVATL